MGYSRLSVDVPVPEEFRYRWIIQVAMKKSDGGKSAESREEYEAYIARDIPYSVVTRDEPTQRSSSQPSREDYSFVVHPSCWKQLFH